MEASVKATSVTMREHYVYALLMLWKQWMDGNGASGRVL